MLEYAGADSRVVLMQTNLIPDNTRSGLFKRVKCNYFQVQTHQHVEYAMAEGFERVNTASAEMPKNGMTAESIGRSQFMERLKFITDSEKTVDIANFLHIRQSHVADWIRRGYAPLLYKELFDAKGIDMVWLNTGITTPRIDCSSGHRLEEQKEFSGYVCPALEALAAVFTACNDCMAAKASAGRG